MRKERELIQKIIDKLDANTPEDVRVIAEKEQFDERANNMIAVGITNVSPFHSEAPEVPDYNFTVRILIDSFIKEDREGYNHDQIVETVEEYLETYLNDQTRLSEIFDDIPIVAMFMANEDNSSNEQSNQTMITLQIVGSYPD